MNDSLVLGQTGRWPSVCISVRVVIGVVFLSAAVAKSINILSFAGLVQYHLAPITRDPTVASVVALCICRFEATAGASLMLNRASRIASAAAVFLLFVFSLFIVRLLNDARAPTCGCGGVLNLLGRSAAEAPFALTRNAVLAVALILVWPRSLQKTVDSGGM